MRLNNYSVRIIRSETNSPVQEKDGYCTLQHKDQYKIALKNYSDLDAHAEICIDGKSVGLYLVKANSKLIVESPNNDSDDDGLFTFFKYDSEEGEILYDDVVPDNAGLIQVKFVSIKKDTKPETIQQYHNCYYNYGSYRFWLDFYWDRYTLFPNKIYPIWKVDTSTTGIAPHYPTSYNSTADTSKSNVVFATANAAADEFSAGGTGLTGYSDKSYDKPTADNNQLLLDTLTVINLRLVHSDLVDKPRKIQGFSNPIPPSLI